MPFNRAQSFGRFMLRVAGYELLELVNSLILMLGAYAVLRPDTDIFSQGQAWKVLSQLIPENGLGAAFLVLGLYTFVALLDGSLRFRQIVSFFTCAFWALLFCFMLAGNPSGLAYLWVGLFALISVVVAARLRVDIDNHIPSWTARV